MPNCPSNTYITLTFYSLNVLDLTYFLFFLNCLLFHIFWKRHCHFSICTKNCPKKFHPYKIFSIGINETGIAISVLNLFLAELFTTAMFFNWKGARTKSHEK